MSESILHIGDVMDILPTLPAESVNCVVTSPPYWGLRDYGTATWSGGDAECDHARPTTTYNAGFNERYGNSSGQRKQETKNDGQYSIACPKCRAVRIDSQLGLEPTPDEYVAKMVAVFREVRRVLRDDGTLWLNLGDSYAGGGNNRGNNSPISEKQGSNAGATGQCAMHAKNADPRSIGLKPKDLVGIPWRVAFALQADGWYLRSDIIWSKPNPTPESVTDRPTKAHEYVFLMSRAARYWYDADAVSESLDTAPHAPGNNGRNGVTMQERHTQGVSTDPSADPTRVWAASGRRNRRTVWQISTQPYPDAHFATYPEKLVEPCVLAGCPVGGTVLDPFTGSGTTGAVACRLGRNFVGIELNPEYAAMAERRIAPHRDQLQLDVR